MTRFPINLRRSSAALAVTALLAAGPALAFPRTGGADVPHSAADAAEPDEARVLHVVVAADVNARNADRLGIPQDSVNVEQNLRAPFEQAGEEGRVRFHPVPPEQCSAGGILDFVRGLDVTPQDAVLFYASSHGMWDPRRGHCLTLGHDGAPRDHFLFIPELRQALLAKNPGAVFILTDCCSNCFYVSEQVVPERSRGLPARSVNGPTVRVAARWETVRELFLRQPRGTVLHLTAARKGLSGQGDPLLGGAFTCGLLRALAEPVPEGRHGHALWTEVFGRVEHETNRLAWERYGGTQVPELVELGLTPARPSAAASTGTPDRGSPPSCPHCPE